MMSEQDEDVDDGEQELIEAKVVALLGNRRELIIDRGHADGVEIGMRFAILLPEGLPITDPDTGDHLGAVDVVKAMVKVVRFQDDHLSIARTFRTIAATPGLDLFGGNSVAAIMRGIPAHPQILNVDSDDLLRPDPNKVDMKVRRGDLAVEAIGEAYEADD